MHLNVTIKNVSWHHFSWPTLYMKPTFFKMPITNSLVTGCFFSETPDNIAIAR